MTIKTIEMDLEQKTLVWDACQWARTRAMQAMTDQQGARYYDEDAGVWAQEGGGYDPFASAQNFALLAIVRRVSARLQSDERRRFRARFRRQRQDGQDAPRIPNRLRITQDEGFALQQVIMTFVIERDRWVEASAREYLRDCPHRPTDEDRARARAGSEAEHDRIKRPYRGLIEELGA